MNAFGNIGPPEPNWIVTIPLFVKYQYTRQKGGERIEGCICKLYGLRVGGAKPGGSPERNTDYLIAEKTIGAIK